MLVPPSALRSNRKPPLGGVSNIGGASLYRGLITAYLLNEGGGLTLFDSLRGGAPAALSSTFNWTQGNAGPAVNFNGGTATTTSTTAIDPLSIAMWVQITSLSGNQVCAAKTSSLAFGVAPQGGGWDVYFDGSFMIFRACAADNSNVQAQISLSDSNWHLFTWTWDRKVMDATSQGFFDGRLVTLTTAGSFGASSYATDGTFALKLGSFGGTTPMSNGRIGAFMAWNRRLSAPEVLDLYVATYPALVPSYPRISGIVPAPSSDYIFYDSYPYARKNQVSQQKFERNYIADASFAFQIPSSVPNFGYHFYDSFPYARKAQIAQQGFPRSDVDFAFEQNVVVTGPAPSSDYIFYDSADYIRAKRQLATFNRNWIADASWFAAIPAPVAPNFGYHFYDANNYPGRAQQLRQSAFERNWSVVTQAANLPLAFDHHFYDRTDYQTLARRLANFQRNYIADASFLFTAAGIPNFGYHFYDAANYALPRLRLANFDRNWVASTGGFPAITFPVPNFGYHFNDSNDYTGHAIQRRQRAFERTWLADVPPGVFIAALFIPPDGWFPIVNPLAIPVRPRLSEVVIGLPNDLRDGTRLPMWDILQIGEDARAFSRYQRLLYKEWIKQEPMNRNLRNFLSVFFNATMAPFSGNLQKTATRKFNATMNPFAGVLAILAPRSSAIVGYALAVCQELRTFIGHKFNTATICEDVRTVKVPVNTQSICQTFIKDPQATTDYSIDWTDPLINASDTIATSVWASDVGLTIAKSTFTGYVTTAFISGGVEGTSYSVTNTITTAGGRTLAQNFIISAKLR